MSIYILPLAGSHHISLEEAVTMTTLYRNQKENLLLPEYRNENLLCTSETFNLKDLQLLLNQGHCAGMRIYYGMQQDLSIHTILVAVDEDGNDILSKEPEESSDNEILQNGKRCPPICPPASGILNP